MEASGASRLVCNTPGSWHLLTPQSPELKWQLLLDKAEALGSMGLRFLMEQDRMHPAAHRTWSRSLGNVHTQLRTCSERPARTPCPGPQWPGPATAWKDRGGVTTSFSTACLQPHST